MAGGRSGGRRTIARRWGRFGTTADIGVWARGRSPADLLEALALGLVALMIDPRAVRRRDRRTIAVEGDDAPARVVAYLTAVLDAVQADGFVPRSVRVDWPGPTGRRWVAELYGEPWDPVRHPKRIEVKAVTFHRLQFDLDRLRARVIVDI